MVTIFYVFHEKIPMKKVKKIVIINSSFARIHETNLKKQDKDFFNNFFHESFF